MANASPEEMKAIMDEWIKWRGDASKTIKVESGMPLQSVNNVISDGVTESQNQASGYSILEGDQKK